ncbi:MAG: hypothetical protein ACK5PP_00835 [Acidimicrobiales bacterium]
MSNETSSPGTEHGADDAVRRGLNAAGLALTAYLVPVLVLIWMLSGVVAGWLVVVLSLLAVAAVGVGAAAGVFGPNPRRIATGIAISALAMTLLVVPAVVGRGVIRSTWDPGDTFGSTRSPYYGPAIGAVVVAWLLISMFIGAVAARRIVPAGTEPTPEP